MWSSLWLKGDGGIRKPFEKGRNNLLSFADKKIDIRKEKRIKVYD